MADQILAQTRAVIPQAKTVSIIINNYNYGCFLRDAIDSALAQTYPHVEVVVVDDGSTDNSRKVISDYGDRIVPIFKENGGLASALNAGYRASKGDVIFFLDSDDALLPTAVERVLAGWGDGVSHVYFPLAAIDGNGHALGGTIGGVSIPDPALGPFCIHSPTSGNAFSRSAIGHAMPIPERELERYGDAYLTAVSSLVGKVRGLPEPLGKYRVHARSMSRGDVGLAQARRSVCADLRLHKTLVMLAPESVGSLEKWLSRSPRHWVNRITSLRESPSDHPWPGTLAELLRRATGATWRHPYWNFRRKVAYTAFVTGYSLSPVKIRNALKKLEEGAQATLPRALLGWQTSSIGRTHRVGK